MQLKSIYLLQNSKTTSEVPPFVDATELEMMQTPQTFHPCSLRGAVLQQRKKKELVDSSPGIEPCV